MKKLFMLMFAILVLTACTEVTHNVYTFSGESEHWEAVYSYKGTEKWGGTGTYSNEDWYELTIKYKGPLGDLASIDKLEYSYETISSQGVITEEFNAPPSKAIYTTGGGSNGVQK